MPSQTLIAAALIASIAAPPVAVSVAPDPPPVQSAHSHADGIIPFTSNGCSGFREARFFSCCYVHDLAYWAGGTRSDRTRADRTLRDCLRDISHDPLLSYVGWGLIRLGYIPGMFCCDGGGWGRAWRNTDHARYATLTPDEARQVLDEKQRICRSLTLNPATGKYRVDDTREIRANQASQICPSIRP